jgi:hypothetical protein
MQTAMALTLACEVKSLQRENSALRETIRKLKARKCYSSSGKVSDKVLGR